MFLGGSRVVHMQLGYLCVISHNLLHSYLLFQNNAFKRWNRLEQRQSHANLPNPDHTVQASKATAEGQGELGEVCFVRSMLWKKREKWKKARGSHRRKAMIREKGESN